MDVLIDTKRSKLLARNEQLNLELMGMELMSNDSNNVASANAQVRRKGKIKEELESITKERLLLAPLSGSRDPFICTHRCEQCSEAIPLMLEGHIIRCPVCDEINYCA